MEKRGGGSNNAERMPWRGLFLLCGAADEPQMDGQLLRISEPREVGVTPERYVYFEVRRSKEHLQREVVDSGPYFVIHAPFRATWYSTRRVLPNNSQGAPDHWTSIGRRIHLPFLSTAWLLCQKHN